MRVCYITHSAPCGKGETFIINELNTIRKYFDVVILPLRPRGTPQYEEAKMLLDDSVIIPLFNFRIFIHFLFSIFSNPVQVFTCIANIFTESRSLRVLFRNLCVVPKAFYVTNSLKDLKISHIHCHWSCIQTTFGSIVAKNLGVGFSFTAHSYDIDENNMLRQKVLESSFVRAISQNAKNQIIELTGLDKLNHKIHVIHMGVTIPKVSNKTNHNKKSRKVIVCPANVEEIKGQKYLIEACAISKSKGLSLKCLIIGEGPDIPKLKSLITEKGLEDDVFLEGYYPHSKLMGMMQNENIDIVILPSITMNNGYSEGIPVALIEAMSYKIPVISTNTGDISELLGQGRGIMVAQKNPEELSEAITNVVTDKSLSESLRTSGFQRVNNEYNIQSTCKDLADLIKQSVE